MEWFWDDLCLGVDFIFTEQNWIKHIKGSNERLFIMTQTHSLQIFRVIPFIKLQNDT